METARRGLSSTTLQPLKTSPAPPADPPAVAPAQTPSAPSLFGLLVAVVIIAALYLAREVLIPVTLAILLSFVLAPLVGWLRRLPIGRTAPVLLAVTSPWPWPLRWGSAA